MPSRKKKPPSRKQRTQNVRKTRAIKNPKKAYTKKAGKRAGKHS